MQKFVRLQSRIFRQISVSILKRIRGEEKFDSVDLLKAQIEKDKIQTLSYLENL